MATKKKTKRQVVGSPLKSKKQSEGNTKRESDRSKNASNTVQKTKIQHYYGTKSDSIKKNLKKAKKGTTKTDAAKAGWRNTKKTKTPGKGTVLKK